MRFQRILAPDFPETKSQLSGTFANRKHKRLIVKVPRLDTTPFMEAAASGRLFVRIDDKYTLYLLFIEIKSVPGFLSLRFGFMYLKTKGYL